MQLSLALLHQLTNQLHAMWSCFFMLGQLLLCDHTLSCDLVAVITCIVTWW